MLGAAKMQYDQFAKTLEKVRRQITTAGNTIEEAQKRNGMIQRKLRNVELPEGSEQDAARLLGLDEPTADEEPADEPADEVE